MVLTPYPPSPHNKPPSGMIYMYLPARTKPTSSNDQPSSSCKNIGRPISNQTSRAPKRKNLAAESTFTLRPLLKTPFQSISPDCETPKFLGVPRVCISDDLAGTRRGTAANRTMYDEFAATEQSHLVRPRILRRKNRAVSTFSAANALR